VPNSVVVEVGHVHVARRIDGNAGGLEKPDGPITGQGRDFASRRDLADDVTSPIADVQIAVAIDRHALWKPELCRGANPILAPLGTSGDRCDFAIGGDAANATIAAGNEEIARVIDGDPGGSEKLGGVQRPVREAPLAPGERGNRQGGDVGEHRPGRRDQAQFAISSVSLIGDCDRTARGSRRDPHHERRGRSAL
jgi:hypothetical protein